MHDRFESERIKISHIAREVKTSTSQLTELEAQARQLQSELASLPQVLDEDGNDLNENYRSALMQQQANIEAEIRSMTQRRNAAMGRAAMLAASYSKEAENEKKNAAQHAKNAQGMKALSGKRFGAAAAASTAAASEKRASDYEKSAELYRKLAQAAERARQGIEPGAIGSAPQKEGVQMPGAGGMSFSGTGTAKGGRIHGAHTGGGGNSSASGKSVGTGSVRQSTAVSATCSFLGISGNQNGGEAPMYERVAHAKETVSALPGSAAAAAQADTSFAQKFGMSILEAAAYRKENGLIWCTGRDGKSAYLVPGYLQEDVPEGHVCPEPTPAEKEAVYMQAHGYTEHGSEKCMRDPEYLVLHQQAHPEEQVAAGLLPFDVRVGWVKQVVPGVTDAEAKSITRSMELYSAESEYYKMIHRDSDAKMSETRDILKVFDSGNVTPYCGEIHRGISFSSREQVLKVLASNGGDWKEPGITSFSSSTAIAERFAAQDHYGLVLHCPNNRSAIPFRHMSINSHEDEVLSPGQLRNNGWRIDFSSIREDPVKRIIYVDIHEYGG